jgi:hypothetical protein
MASGSPNLCQVYYPDGPQYASIVVSFGGAFFCGQFRMTVTKMSGFTAGQLMMSWRKMNWCIGGE